MLNINKLTHLYSNKSTDGISNLSLKVKTGEIFCLLGPSGSGKSTTLKCIAGLIDNYQGKIEFSQKHEVSYVDQSIHLNESQDVFSNIKDALKAELSEEQTHSQIRTVLSRLELTNEINTLASNLSGGQKQRVVMAKSLVNNPTMLLLDEPFANLDPILRTDLIHDLLSIFKQENITVIWVTHNTQEALRYSDKCALLNFGKLYQVGSPLDIYHHPTSLFVAQYFGECNCLVAKAIEISDQHLLIKVHEAKLEVKKNDHPVEANQNILLFIKPEAIEIAEGGRFEAVVTSKEFLGSESLLGLSWKNQSLWCKTQSMTKTEIGQTLKFNIQTQSLHYLNEV